MKSVQEEQVLARERSAKFGRWSTAFTAIMVVVAAALPATAGPKDKPFTSTVLKLSDFKGKTFFDFMEAKDGLHVALNSDISEPIKVVDLKKLKEIIANDFDPAVFKKITGMLKGGAKGFDEMFAELEARIESGKVLTMDNISNEIRNILSKKGLLSSPSKGGLAPLVIAPLVAMGSGAGTTVVLDDSNFFLNYYYKLGPEDEGADELIQNIMKKDGVSYNEARKTLEAAALKSGRNFGYSGSEKLLDFSDTYLLKKFDKWVDGASAKEASAMWNTMFDILTKCDTSGLKNLSVASQSVVTGWLTVYTAELRRHVMVNMVNSAHPWENDLTEALITSVFVKNNGGFLFADKSVRNAKRTKAIPEFVKGGPANFFGIGTQGSGIGVNRMERRALQTLITKALEESHPDEVAAVRKLIGKDNGDIIRGMMEFLNNPKNQKAVRANAEELNKSFGAIMEILHDEKQSKKILSYFADVGAAGPVLKKEFVSVVCGSYVKR
ncbi:MAG: hypothetical protein JST04_14730 [Bdellovibrionales bacterium]|nr:hypothetical protein [Bdellovibrionales bacterium]